MGPDIDDEMIGRAREGDMAAFEAIYRYYAGMVYRVALKMVMRSQDAEEVVQLVFLAVHRGLAGFGGDAALRTWIYRITINCSLNVLKKRKTFREVAWEEGFDPEDPRQDARAAVENEALQSKATALLAELNPDQKACLLLRAQEGLSYDEIARTLNININTVRTRIKRAREVLLRKKGLL
jgi:RNA polymerase sigma-70 factor, ECF subfamily